MKIRCKKMKNVHKFYQIAYNLTKFTMKTMKCFKKYYCVLDFEANCSGEQKRDHEIIEFPAILIESSTGKTISEFRTFVHTIKTGKVSKFINKLTNITDDDLKTGVVWSNQNRQGYPPGALELFEEWCNKNGITSENTMMITCGDWDLKTMLPRQLIITNTRLSIPMQKLFGVWNNVKISYVKYWKLKKRMGMARMLEHSKIPLVGHHHSGIDDTRNIAKICMALVALNYDVTEPNRMLDQRYMGQEQTTIPKNKER